MFLIDTNVLSEVRKGVRCNPGVQALFRNLDESQIYIPVLVLGEIRRGIELMRERGERSHVDRLSQWVQSLLDVYRDRILDFDLECAQIWGRLMVNPQHPVDKQIAAIALSFDMTVLTRNVTDFSGTGVRVQNPFI